MGRWFESPTPPRPQPRQSRRLIEAAPPPDWLTSAWAGAKRRGLDAMPLDEINAEIKACRREKDLADREVK